MLFCQVAVIYLGISFHQNQVDAGGEMLVNSTVDNKQGYRNILFKDEHYNQFIECLFNKSKKCKAYYNFDHQPNHYVVNGLELDADRGDMHGVYYCTDGDTFYYVLCANSASSLNCQSTTCNSFQVTIVWQNNQEYFYSEHLRNCSLSCFDYNKLQIKSYDRILPSVTEIIQSNLLVTTSLVTTSLSPKAIQETIVNTENPNSPLVMINTTTAKLYIYNSGTNLTTTVVAVVVVIVVILAVCIIVGFFVWRKHRKSKQENTSSGKGKVSVQCASNYHMPNNTFITSNQVTSDNSNRYVIQDNKEIKSDHVDDYTTIDDSDLANMSRVVITNTEHNTGDYTELEIDEQSSVNGSVLASSCLDTEDTTSSKNVNSTESDGHVDYADIKFDPPNTTYARLGEGTRQLTNPYGCLADIKEVLSLSPYTLAKDIPGQVDLQIIDPGCFTEKD